MFRDLTNLTNVVFIQAIQQDSSRRLRLAVDDFIHEYLLTFRRNQLLTCFLDIFITIAIAIKIFVDILINFFINIFVEIFINIFVGILKNILVDIFNNTFIVIDIFGFRSIFVTITPSFPPP